MEAGECKKVNNLDSVPFEDNNVQPHEREVIIMDLVPTKQVEEVGLKLPGDTLQSSMRVPFSN